MRGRGNAYCAKVWLGLHDGKLIGNDAESIKEFIIQKYEKKRCVHYMYKSTRYCKVHTVLRSYESRYMLRFSLFFRYYVDPSTIRHSLGSTASTVSSISQQSDGCNLVPLASSINSSSGTSKGSEMIGTTIQLQLHSKKQHNIASQMLPNSSSRY